MLTTLVTILLPLLGNCASEVANYPLITTMKTGEHKMFLETAVGPTTKNFIQPFFVSYSSPPYVGIGLLVFQAEPTGNDIGFTALARNITTTQFISEVSVNNGTTFNELRYMYLSIDKTQNFGVIYLVQYSGLTQFTGAINTRVEFEENFNQTYNLSNVNLFVPVLDAFEMTAANNQFSVRVDAEPLSTTSFKVIVQSNSTLTAVSMYVVWVDQTALEATHTRYFDVGFTFGANSQAVDSQLDIPTSSFNYFNYIQGANWLNFNTNQILSVNFNGGPVSTLSAFNFVRANSVHWLERQCRTFTYYLHAQAKCYDVCPSGFAENTTFNYCQQCDYTCAECQSDGVTCTSCDNSSSRFFHNNSACLCRDGFFDSGVPICQACDYTCTTCTTSSTNCLTCDSTRQLINNQCPCLQGNFDQNQAVCGTCDYTCLSCQSSATNCISCNQSAFRILTSSNECLCSSGFSDKGVELCQEDIVCDSICQTCENASTTCTSCQSGNNRIFLNNGCPCIDGYESVFNALKCTQICGDGRVFEDACDDGNTVNGDGCSSTCFVEDSYDCDNTTVPTLCVFIQGYTITFVSLQKHEYENKIDISFMIVPAPPSSSIPTITGIANTSSSFNLSGSALTVTLEYSANIPENTAGQLSLTNVNSQANFTFESSNGLALNSYSSSNYTLYNVEVVMIWVLIGIVWFATILFLVLDKNTISWAVEMIISMGVVWVGVKGFDRMLLYFYPLINLQYLFGYNMTISGEDGLLAYVNYGFILNAVPILVAVILFIINAINKNKLLSSEMKKFLLYELSFAALCINAVMVVYGLYTENISKTYSTPLSIGSLCMGVAYLLILALTSVLFVVKEEVFPVFKISMLKPTFFIVTLWLKLGLCLAYLFASESMALSPLLMVGSSFLTMVAVLVVKPYSMNIRYLVNEVSIFLAYLCYVLVVEVEVAEWSGFAIIVLLYIQAVLNILLMVKEVAKENVEDDDSEPEELEYYDKKSERDEVEMVEGTHAKPMMMGDDPTTVKPLREQIL